MPRGRAAPRGTARSAPNCSRAPEPFQSRAPNVIALPAGRLFFPLDLRLQLGGEGYSPALLKRIVSQGGKYSFAEARENLAELCGIPISGQHAMRLTERIGGVWERRRGPRVRRFSAKQIAAVVRAGSESRRGHARRRAGAHPRRTLRPRRDKSGMARAEVRLLPDPGQQTLPSGSAAGSALEIRGQKARAQTGPSRSRACAEPGASGRPHPLPEKHAAKTGQTGQPKNAADSDRNHERGGRVWSPGGSGSVQARSGFGGAQSVRVRRAGVELDGLGTPSQAAGVMCRFWISST